MKRIAVLVACVGLSGCNTLGALGVSQATIDAIQQAATSVCGFLPTVETIASIIAGGMSAVPDQIGNAICTAVIAQKAPGATRAAASARVGATQVQGIFVR